MKSLNSAIYGGIYVVYENGDVLSIKKNRLLPHHSNGKGYMAVNTFINGVQKREYVHRLVALCFIPNPYSYQDVNHIDGRKDNNDKSNLEWVSRKQNIVHAYKNGLFKKEKMIKNHNEWIGQTYGTRKIIGLTNEKSSGGNYKVVVKCSCGNEFSMYYNDLKKNKHLLCRKCPRTGTPSEWKDEIEEEYV